MDNLLLIKLLEIGKKTIDRKNENRNNIYPR